MKYKFVNDWKSECGFAPIMIAWLKLGEFRSFSFIVLGLGVTITRGSLDV